MSLITRFLSTFAFVLLSSGSALAQPADPAVYGALPGVKEVRISPNGQTVATLQSAGGASGVLFYNLAEPGSQPVGVGLGEADARDIIWANDDQLLLLVSQSSNVATSAGIKTIEFFRWVTISKSKAKARVLLGNDAGYFNPTPGELLSLMPNDPKKAVFARYSTSGNSTGNVGPSRMRSSGTTSFTYSLFLVDVESGKQSRLESGEDDTQEWVVTADGRAIVRVDYNPSRRERKIFTRPDGASGFSLVKTIDESASDGRTITFYGPTGAPNKVYATHYAGGDTLSLVEFDIATGEIGAVVFTNPQYDIWDVVYEPRFAAATGVQYMDDIARTHHLNEADRTLQDQLRKAIPGSAPMIVSESYDGSKLIVEVGYTDHPTQFFLYDQTARSLSMIAPAYANLDGKVVAKKEKFDYVSSDGKNIRGYLTVPAGASKQSAPLIVLPHGGPESRSTQGFDYWSFFYAARGYLVYQPNFRGSDGYGFRFRSAGFGEWGHKMQDDITEGVKKLIEDGVADPDRICIVGASYGGYAALAGATLTPDLYACAVSVNGVTNLPGMLGEEARYSELSEDYWSIRIGDRFRDTKALGAVSPASNAENVRAPILLIVSKDDIVVPPFQSIQMRDALKRAGKPHEYVELPGEDHWLSTGASRTEMLRRSIEFIDKHIGQR